MVIFPTEVRKLPFVVTPPQQLMLSFFHFYWVVGLDLRQVMVYVRCFLLPSCRRRTAAAGLLFLQEFHVVVSLLFLIFLEHTLFRFSICRVRSTVCITLENHLSYRCCDCTMGDRSGEDVARRVGGYDQRYESSMPDSSRDE